MDPQYKAIIRAEAAAMAAKNSNSNLVSPAQTPTESSKRKAEVEVEVEVEEVLEAESQRPLKRARLEDLACEVCAQQNSKYRCPRCDRVTCSLACSRAHKVESDCSGKRNRTKFFKLSEMDEGTLQNDMALLSDLSTVRETPAPAHSGKKAENAPRWRLLQSRARELGIHVDYLPPVMSRRRANTSFYAIKEGLLSWRLTWTARFGSGSHSFTLDRALTALRAQRADLSANLETDQSAILFEVAYRASNAKAYFVMPKELSLNDALKGKIVIEFPEFLIVPTSTLEQFVLVEESSDPKSFEGRGQIEHDRFNLLHNVPLTANEHGNDDDGDNGDGSVVDLSVLGHVLKQDMSK